MLHSPIRRGRPKGTGIDDSDRIARLDELLRVHPELRPTTAIRLMGYSNPSAIRRLRDKYKVFTLKTRIELSKDLRGSTPAAAGLSSEQSPQAMQPGR
ncbi:hypothetical protein [Hyphomicrobium sp. 99]|uniref:hypothetical protein n=1 Tax=Hyphomicrobium sp. 99 TaxID=1163419 RepID=UPI0005F7971F|nr:hypothetical protein [Hyphomicrobium sp. 99]